MWTQTQPTAKLSRPPSLATTCYGAWHACAESPVSGISRSAPRSDHADALVAQSVTGRTWKLELTGSTL